MRRDGKISCTYYRNQISKEFVEDCLMLRAAGMRFDDIALSLAKTHGYVKDSSVKYACGKAV